MWPLKSDSLGTHTHIECTALQWRDRRNIGEEIPCIVSLATVDFGGADLCTFGGRSGYNSFAGVSPSKIT